MIKLFAMAAEAGERSHEGGPQRSKTIMVRSDILRLPISDRPTAGQTRCVFRSGRRRVPDANNNGRCPTPFLLCTRLCTNKLPAQRLSHTIPCPLLHSLQRKQPEKNGEV
jgi:hypothetical protein